MSSPCGLRTRSQEPGSTGTSVAAPAAARTDEASPSRLAKKGDQELVSDDDKLAALLVLNLGFER